MEIICQPLDFLGINHYFSQRVSADANVWPVCSRLHRQGDKATDMGWGVYPQGLYDLLVRLDSEYKHLPILITENGAAYQDVVSEDGHIYDIERQEYLIKYIQQVHRAIKTGVNVKGYYLWSFMDNFEWAYGYSKRFGIVYVDYKSQQRTIKQSGYWYSDVIRQNGIKL